MSSRRRPRLPVEAESPSVVVGDIYGAEPSFVVRRNRLQQRFTDVYIHPIVEIGVVVGGQGTLYHNGVEYDLRTGSGYFLDMASPHRHEPAGRLESIYVHIQYDSLESLAPRDAYLRLTQPFLLLQGGAVAPVMGPNRRYRRLLEAAERLYRGHDPFGYVLAWTRVAEAFVEIARYCEQAAAGSALARVVRSRQTISRALQFIAANYQRPIALGQVAQYCSVSASRLSAVFTGFMHVSPIAYRNRLRINRAVQMLQSSSASVEEIAWDCGFHSLAQFRDLVRRCTGTTPNGLRRRQTPSAGTPAATRPRSA